MDLDSVDWKRLGELCPRIDSTLFNWIHMDRYPTLTSIIRKGFDMPFSELPGWVNDTGHMGLLRGVVLYRLEKGI